MFHYIKGIPESTNKDFAIVENNGIGYKIFVPSSTLNRIGNTKTQVTFYTYFHVREDAVALYGFLTQEELDMFELLISVSGIGPKAGLAILSSLPPSKLGLAIMGSDIKALTAVPGIGSKTAHRIILELKDKIDTSDIIDNVSDIEYSTGNNASEAVNALIALGYSSSEAGAAVRKIDAGDKNTEGLIKDALKLLMK